MRANLVSKVREFGTTETVAHEHSGPASGLRVLRLAFLSSDPSEHDPELFVYSGAQGRARPQDFEEFLLFDATGAFVTRGRRQAPDADDLKCFDADEGTGAGLEGESHDAWVERTGVYPSGPCRFVLDDAVPEGDYTLESAENVEPVFDGDGYEGTTSWTGVRLANGEATQIAPPWLPESSTRFEPDQVTVVREDGHWRVMAGEQRLLDAGACREDAERAAEIIRHYGMASVCPLGKAGGDAKPLTYFLTREGEAPSGRLANEDVFGFDAQSLRVAEVGGRWQIVDRARPLFDFGQSEGSARAALHFLRKHGFSEVGFVGRPWPVMVYFKRGPARRSQGVSGTERRLNLASTRRRPVHGA